MSNLSPNFYPNRNHQKPEIVVLHLTEGNFSGAKGWLCNPASNASCTRLFARSGESVELVSESDAPWTNGFRIEQAPPAHPYVEERCWTGMLDPNLITLSIEVEWFAADGLIPVDSPLFRALVEQVAEWCFRYDIPVERVMGHNEIDPEGKPLCGKHIPWLYFRPAVLARKLEKASLAAAPQTPSPWAASAWAWAKDTGINDGLNPHQPVTEEQVMVFLYRYHLHLWATAQKSSKVSTKNS